ILSPHGAVCRRSAVPDPVGAQANRLAGRHAPLALLEPMADRAGGPEVGATAELSTQEPSFNRIRMSPGGHAATTVVASAATAFMSGSLPLATAVALGGFFIDVDHAIDYVLFNRQRDLRPKAFLRYYLEGRAHLGVLALHSWELFALLTVIAWWTEWPLLWGYLSGAAMHLILDIIF